MADKCFCHLNGYEVKDAYSRTEIESIKTEIETVKTDLESESTKLTNYVDNKFNGSNKAISFDDYSKMISWIKNLTLNDIPSYEVGQNIMIVKIDVPDLWLSRKLDSFVNYTYISDDSFINALKVNGSVQVGYFALSMLETQKVELTDYAKKSELTSYVEKSSVNTLLLEKVYPVGSIYMSVNNINPSSFLGGSWTQIQDRFLLASGSTYSAGTTGGSATHTLTVDEMPSHCHTEVIGSNPGNFFTQGTTNDVYSMESSLSHGAYLYDNYFNELRATGGGQPHNNMPPYLVVYMWKRTA